MEQGMPQEPGIVSLWTGWAESDEALESYLAFGFTEDGDSVPSPFAHDFGIDWFDEDFREAGLISLLTQSLSQLLEGHSNAKALIPKFAATIGDTLDSEANAVLLLFDFRYDGEVREVTHGPVRLRFQGVVRE